MSILESRFTRVPLMVGLGLGRGNGGPYKTITQFRSVQGGKVVSFSEPSTEDVPGDGILHLRSGSGFLSRRLLLINASDRCKFRRLIDDASHVQCHILYRYHAHLIWNECRRAQKPYWVIPHGCLDPFVFSYRRLQKLTWMELFGRRFLRNAQHVVFATKREQRKSQQWLEADNARVLHWPVEIPVLGRNEDDRRKLRLRLGLSENARILLWLGRLHEMKRPLESARLFAELNLGNCHLVFVGNDEAGLGAALCKIAADAPGRNVHWVGPFYGEGRDQIMRGCDGYWSNSARENFNHAAAEALATGLPVILSQGNDLCDDLHGMGVGWLGSDDSVDSVRKFLREWAEASSDTLSSMGKNARSWAKETLSMDRFRHGLQSLQTFQ